EVGVGVRVLDDVLPVADRPRTVLALHAAQPCVCAPGFAQGARTPEGHCGLPVVPRIRVAVPEPRNRPGVQLRRRYRLGALAYLRLAEHTRNGGDRHRQSGFRKYSGTLLPITRVDR